jgi:hypothetical protein
MALGFVAFMDVVSVGFADYHADYFVSRFN